MTGAHTSGGGCGLIRGYAKNLIQVLTCTDQAGESRPTPSGGTCTGAAWLSSARAVRCWVKSRNERNPRPQLLFLGRLPGEPRRKVGMMSSPHGPYVWGFTHATMAGTVGCHFARRSQSPKSGLSTDCRLQPACMKSELLVTARQHSAVNAFPGLVHTARHTTKAGKTRSRRANPPLAGGGRRRASGR